jgi:hypothetical protein
MTSYQVMKNHLRLADDVVEVILGTGEPKLTKLKFKFGLYCVRALCAALNNISDVIKEK